MSVIFTRLVCGAANARKREKSPARGRVSAILTKRRRDHELPWIFRRDHPSVGGVLLYSAATEPSWCQTKSIVLVPPKGYLLIEASLNSKPSPGLEGRGTRPSTMRMARNPNHSAQIFSLSPGFTKLQIS